ncbi:MAG: hypothetical protein RI964_1793 [Pseudomonadota bacterium]|jgi:hypothetical protein
MRNQKSRLLKPFGTLPKDIKNPVSVRVSTQQEDFDFSGKLIRPKNSEHIMPMFEAIRESRNSLLLGDLGTGKSTIVAQLVLDTLDKSSATVTVLVPAKSLKLDSRFTVRELITIVNNFLIKDVLKEKQEVNLEGLLNEHTEILIIFDGLDELSQEIASRLLEKAARFTETWSTIQVVATARPIELKGISFANWKVIHTASLSIERKQQFIIEELIADGLDIEKSKQESEVLIKKLKEQSELNSLASTPLTIRLIYPHLKKSTPDKSNTLGDLLYELLLIRLEDWQKRDDKPSNFDCLESIYPTAEAKMELLSILTMKAMEKPSISVDEAKAIFLDKAESNGEKKAYLLVKEALSYFEWLGLITITDVIDFPLQSLAEMSAAHGLLKEWKSKDSTLTLPSNSQWRIVSFLATIARRRGQLEQVSQCLHKYIQQLLIPRSPNLPAACYIVAESNNYQCAKVAIKSFDKLERRPLTFFGDDHRTSAWNIARTIWLAEDAGFNWLYTHYLDPKYPIINAGSLVIQDVFSEWAAIAHANLNSYHKKLLAKLVPPYLATEGAQFYGVLDILALLVPNEFKISDRLWYLSHSLDSLPFGDWVLSQFKTAPIQDRVCLEKILSYNLGSSKKAASFWLELNPDKEPPIPLIKQALRLITLSNTYNSITTKCIARLGQEKWMHFVRWFLFDSDRSVATGAVIILYRHGERRLSILGNTLVDSLHDGGYQANAEEILLNLIKEAGDKGVRWLASQISNYSDYHRAHSGLWRILLSQISNIDDGPELLAGCIHNLGEFVLPRYPEVREAFSQLFNGLNGEEYKTSLRKQLYSLDPMIREGAAKILTSTNPQTEGDALFVAVRSRASRNNHRDQHEWERFCLSLNFSHGVLTLLQSRLHMLDPKSQSLALFILIKNSIEIQDEQRNNLKSQLLNLDNWHLARDPVGKSLLSTQESFTYLLSILDKPIIKGSKRAAEYLLELHGDRLTPKDKARCMALSSKYTGWPHDLTNLMVQITTNQQFAEAFIQASNEIKANGGKASLLEIILNSSKGKAPWKDVLWAMLCDDTSFRSSSESETNGSALLEYGLKISQYRKAIGDAAIECLSDPRMKNNRWTDAYHWLAVIADEFTGLLAREIESILRKSNSTIHAEATTSLIARLGYVPEGVQFRRGYGSKPDLSVDKATHEVEFSSAIQKLNDFSRDSDTLHPELITTIEQCLYFSPLDNQAITAFSANGKPGMLIATTLRHCYGYSPQLFETISLLDHWGVTNNTNDQAKKKLQDIWRTIRYSIHDMNDEVTTKYLEELDKNLFSNNGWELFIAFEILRVRGCLLVEQIDHVFLKYVDHTSYLHRHIFEELIKWLSGDLNETTKQAVIRSTHAALVTLNENSLYSSYGDDSIEWVFCIFPVIQWVLEGKQTPAAESIFLRSLQCALETSHVTLLISKLEPLLNMVPQHIIRETIISGKENPEPFVRGFCGLIKKFS